MNVYQRVKVDPAKYFTPEEVAKSKAYQRPLMFLRILSLIINLALLVALAGLRIGPRLVDGLGLDAWPLQLLAVASTFLVASVLVGLPVSAYTTFGHEKRWGFSTQTVGRWVSDHIKGLLVGLVVVNLLFLALWAVIRTTDLWWLFGTLVLAAFAVLLVFLGPVLIFPLFNKFTPAGDEELRDRLRNLAQSGGIRVSDVLVMDASKRTRHDNAFFTGLGKTKRVVLFDNMTGWDRPVIDVVVGHEVGHWRHRHVAQSIAISTVTSLVVFVALRYVMTWDAALDWAGVGSVQEPAALPLFLLGFSLGSLVTGLLDKWFSRAHERQADLYALDLTKDPVSYGRLFREFSSKDLPDLAPSWWSRINATHPPMAERMAFGEEWARAST